MPPFPRDKIFRTASQRIKAYSSVNPLSRIPIDQHEITHEDQTFRYRYVVRVTTLNEDDGTENNRYISLTDDKRFTVSDLQGAAQDLVMNSPVSSNESFVDATIVFALRKG